MSDQLPDNDPVSCPRTVKPWQANGLLLLALIVLGLYVVSYRPDVPAVFCDESGAPASPDVVMLGAWWCRYCSQARQYFHENDIQYCEYDVERSEEGRKRYADAGGGAVPILIFGERYRFQGFDERAVERGLALLDKERSTGDRPN